VTDEHRLLGARLVEQADEVSGEGMDVVVLDGFGSARTAVSALVGRQHVVAGVCQHGDLVAPGVSKFGEAVGQHNGWCGPFARLDESQGDAIELD
jgi:hypothetical protein